MVTALRIGKTVKTVLEAQSIYLIYDEIMKQAVEQYPLICFSSRRSTSTQW